jgi:fluoride exporter
MLRFFIIALGGAIGTVSRYLVSELDHKYSQGPLPFNTLLINVSGSLLLGFLWGLFERYAVSPNIRLFVFIGLIGGYTTFSTFSLETFTLMRDGEYGIALANISLSIILSVAVVFAGYFASRQFLNLLD